ncbi:MAG: PRC-barrel domain-containing protein [Longimicrobiales bacterium]
MLAELEEMAGFAVGSGDPDPRGWTVVACNGEAVGIIRTLIIDTELLKVRYFVTELHVDNRLVLLPVALARVDAPAGRIVYDVSTVECFGCLPAYPGVPSDVDDDLLHMTLIGDKPAAPNPGASADRRQQSRRGRTNA